MEKEFTAEQMIEFASWYGGDDINEHHLEDYVTVLKQREEEEYQHYLSLKTKYENKQ